MKRDLITAKPETTIEDAARLLYDSRIGCLPILVDGSLVGIITETDLLRALSDLLTAKAPSTRLEIRMPNKPGELARVARLIGIEHRVNITGLIITQAADGSHSTAIMQIQTDTPTRVIEALRKIGYDVGWPALGYEDGVLVDPDYAPAVGPSLVGAG
jgi:acetoin utilization protein AcuB